MDEETFQELREEGTAAEVASFFIDDAYEILDDIDSLMSVPAHPRPLSLPLLSVTDSSCLLWNSQAAARSGLRRGGSPCAAAHGVHLQVMTMINTFFFTRLFLIFNYIMFVCPLRRCRTIQMCLSWANDSYYLLVALPRSRNYKNRVYLRLV